MVRARVAGAVVVVIVLPLILAALNAAPLAARIDKALAAGFKCVRMFAAAAVFTVMSGLCREDNSESKTLQSFAVQTVAWRSPCCSVAYEFIVLCASALAVVAHAAGPVAGRLLRGLQLPRHL